MKKTNRQAVSRIPFLSPFVQFVKGESAGGVFLILAACIAFVIANSGLSQAYFGLKETTFGLEFGDWGLKKALVLWINDGLMAIFFLLVGLEIKRELLVGELSRPKDAALSVFAALGGMVVPALIYTYFNWGGEGLSGWGIPMATDIAFALGILSLLGNRVPLSLKVFLTALAIVDDLGAVVVIALFYTANLSTTYLYASFFFLAVAFVFSFLGVRRLPVYWLLGIIAWYFMLKSGVHATVAGVLLAFAIPISREKEPEWADTELKSILHKGTFEEVEGKMEKLEDVLEQIQSPLHRLEHGLQPWVAYFIMPVFAFFNAGVSLQSENQLWTPVTFGCLLGLLIGKPIGIFLFSWLSVKLGISSLPEGVRWPQIGSVGVLAGIGFTMSFFIAGLAFENPAFLDQSKIGILSASILAAVIGLSMMTAFTKKKS